jgi:dipeptidyl aminopeptidase/acylaminoacyl peptidase
MTNTAFSEVERWVRSEAVAARQLGIVDISSVAAHPSRDLVACTVSTRSTLDAEPRSQTAVVELTSGQRWVLDLGAENAHVPIWAPDGRLAVLTSSDDGVGTAVIVELSADDPAAARVAHRLPAVAGSVESLAWSPAGDRVCLVVAPFGAEVSDVYGSGVVRDPEGDQSWRPTVTPSPGAGRRLVHVWVPEDGSMRQVSPALNAWEAAWFGAHRLLALVSEGAGEGAWYAAELHGVDLDGGATVLHRSTVQMAQPGANPSGQRWSVLESRASDRGLLAGNLIVGDENGSGVRCPPHDVDVSAYHWLDDRRIAFAGIRGLDTVYGVVNVTTDEVHEVLVTEGSSGLYQPEAGGWTAEGDLVAVLEQHAQPPTLTVVGAGGTRELVSTAGPGTAHVIDRCGRTLRKSWTSTDGTPISGLVTVPDGEGPFRLVVNVHGGPVAAWTDGWIGRDPYTALLVARGFAVLRPNLRGSTGSGQEFIEAIVGDMGGADVDDVTTGVQLLIDEGLADAGRVGLTGNSYGGYMAAWVPCRTDIFAASVSRSPVTDFFSQHYTGNLAEFDEIFVDGSPIDPGSQYWTRNPVIHAQRVKTPMLLTAGRNDLATPPSQAQMMHRALLEVGVPTELVIYPLEGHGVHFPDALTDQIARMITWFETYL